MHGTYQAEQADYHTLNTLNTNEDLSNCRCCSYTLIIHTSYKVLIFGIILSWFVFSGLIYAYYTQPYNISEYVLYIFLFITIVVDYIMIHFYIRVRRRAILQNFLNTHVHPKMAYETQM